MDEELPGMLAVAKAVHEQRWPHTMDAKVWADEFVKVFPDIECGTMIGWFANAIMAGYDTAQSRANNEAVHLRMQIGYIVGELQLAGDKRSTPEIVETAAKATSPT